MTNVRQPAVVTDTGSTKRAIVEAARALPPRFTFVGGHPLGGAAGERPRARAAGSLQETAVAVYAGRRRRRRRLEKLLAFMRALGAMPRS